MSGNQKQTAVILFKHIHSKKSNNYNFKVKHDDKEVYGDLESLSNRAEILEFTIDELLMQYPTEHKNSNLELMPIRFDTCGKFIGYLSPNKPIKGFHCATYSRMFCPQTLEFSCGSGYTIPEEAIITGVIKLTYLIQ